MECDAPTEEDSDLGIAEPDLSEDRGWALDCEKDWGRALHCDGADPGSGGVEEVILFMLI